MAYVSRQWERSRALFPFFFVERDYSESKISGDELSAEITEVIEAVSGTTTLSALERYGLLIWVKKGYLTLQLKQIGSLPVEERKAYGQALNIAKQKLAVAIDRKAEFLEQQAQSNALDRDIIDVSLPGRAIQHGTLHPISRSVRGNYNHISTARI
ncbi:MAG: hypothetical protein CM1200mP39_30850 [Dehalococcoidia bacterium]|nr:MAG: hypothetical protein CM1200mP39_30850 [Dehalococcoidia bacterium]